MTTGYQIKNQEGLHYLTFQVVDWVDIFTRPVYKDIIIDSFKYAMENKHLQVFAYVIMSNHVHLVAQSTVGQLSNTIRDIKKYTSKRIIDTIYSIPESRREWMINRFQFNARKHKRNSKYGLMKTMLYTYTAPTSFAEKIEYIHNNPVRALIVQNPEDYLYSGYAIMPVSTYWILSLYRYLGSRIDNW